MPTDEQIEELLHWLGYLPPGCKCPNAVAKVRALFPLDQRVGEAHAHLAAALKAWFLHSDKQEAKSHLTAAYGLLDQIVSTPPAEVECNAASAESDPPPADSRPAGGVEPIGRVETRDWRLRREELGSPKEQNGANAD